jgi:hypothetical protein
MNQKEYKKYDLKFSMSLSNYKCVIRAFEEAGFVGTEQNDWNGLWGVLKSD